MAETARRRQEEIRPVKRSERTGKGFGGYHHFAPTGDRRDSWLKGLLSQKTFSIMKIQWYDTGIDGTENQ